MPAVSVILPVKNQEKFIEGALYSIVKQTFTDMEIIVINDGSSDNTGEIIRKFQNDKRIQVIELPQSSGIVTALNTGLNSATGKYIARMDGDDIMHPERIRKQFDFMESHCNISLCGCCVTCFNSAAPLSTGVRNFQNWHNSLLTHEAMRQNIYVDSPMVHPTFMGTRSFFQKMGGYRDTGFAEDYDFIFRAVFYGAKLAKLPEILLNWRDHPRREIRTNPNLKKDRLFRQKARFFRKFDPLSKQPLFLFGVGRFGKALLDALQEEGLEIRGVIDPSGKRLNSGIRGLPVSSLNATFPQNAVIINALSILGTTSSAARNFLKNKKVLHWTL
ncbi:MAG: glycosyltransferase [Acidobacteria bacterium]|nr:glycosyltransferase [Acidobacteriota bacterium]